MKSVAIKDAREFEIKDIDEPIIDKTNVVIEINKAGICGSDIHYWDSGNPKGLVMGHEFSGSVIDPGSRKDLKVGDRVTALPISPCGKCHACLKGNPQYCEETWNSAVGLSLTNPGAYTLKTKVRPDMVYKLPKKMSDEEGAMVEPVAVGLHAIHLADIKLGDKVLVIGGGIIGLVSAMIANTEGASLVVVSETNEARGKKAVKLGVADEWLDAKDPEFIANTRKLTGEGFDIVIDCSGNSKAVTSALMTCKTGGTVVLVGVSMTPIEIPTVIAVMHELKILGAIAYTKEEFKTVIDAIASKQLDVRRFIDDIVPLEKVQASFERLTSGTDDAIKILIDPKK